jgi:hypothetical protein
LVLGKEDRDQQCHFDFDARGKARAGRVSRRPDTMFDAVQTTTRARRTSSLRPLKSFSGLSLPALQKLPYKNTDHVKVDRLILRPFQGHEEFYETEPRPANLAHAHDGRRLPY